MAKAPKVYTHKFGSLSELVDYAEGPSPIEWRNSRKSVGREAFTGVATWTDALDIAFSWAEGAARAERMIASLNVKGGKARKTVEMREVGPGVVSMGHFNAGHPQPYITLQDSPQMRHGKGKIVKLLVNVGALSTVSTNAIETRGAAILALAGALEAAGRRTEITLYSCAEMANVARGSVSEQIEVYCTIKAAHQKFNMRSIAFALSHPAMLRRLIFAVREREPQAVRLLKGGSFMGASVELSEDAKRGYVAVPSLMKSRAAWESRDDARAWVIETAAAQGVRLS